MRLFIFFAFTLNKAHLDFGPDVIGNNSVSAVEFLAVVLVWLQVVAAVVYRGAKHSAKWIVVRYLLYISVFVYHRAVVAKVVLRVIVIRQHFVKGRCPCCLLNRFYRTYRGERIYWFINALANRCCIVVRLWSRRQSWVAWSYWISRPDWVWVRIYRHYRRIKVAVSA